MRFSSHCFDGPILICVIICNWTTGTMVDISGLSKIDKYLKAHVDNCAKALCIEKEIKSARDQLLFSPGENILLTI